MAKRGMAFLDAIAQSESALREERAAAPPAGPPQRPGFVGKALAESNDSLDRRAAEAERRAAESAALAEELQRKIAGGAMAIKIDPKRVRHSRFADRHPCAFRDEEFESFVEEIKATGGNKEPGIVRSLEGDPEYDYELAAGHRRHGACLRSNLPFFAFVRELSDSELLVSMHTENKGRKDLSMFERGRHYVRLLAQGSFSSARSLAAAFNEPWTTMQRLLTYAELTDEIIRAFPDPRVIRQPWISPLKAALERDPEGFGKEVDAILNEGDVAPTATYRRLSGISPRRSIVAGEDKILARVRTVHDCPAVILYKGAPEELIHKITKLIEQFHAEHDGSET